MNDPSNHWLERGSELERTVFFSCFYDDVKGLVSLRGDEKYIYHYDHQLEEVFDLSEDPFEAHNIVDERDEEEIEERRNAVYEGKIVAN